MVRQLVERSILRYSGETREAILAGAAGAALGRSTRGGGPRGARPRARMHALWWVAADLSSDRPLLITVDDAQWADDPSVRFLAYLARRLEDPRSPHRRHAAARARRTARRADRRTPGARLLRTAVGPTQSPLWRRARPRRRAGRRSGGPPGQRGQPVLRRATARRAAARGPHPDRRDDGAGRRGARPADRVTLAPAAPRPGGDPPGGRGRGARRSQRGRAFAAELAGLDETGCGHGRRAAARAST